MPSDEGGTDVGVDHGHARPAFAGLQRLVCRGGGVVHQTDPAEEQGLHVLRQRGQVGGGQHPARRGLVIEGIGRLAVDQLDEGHRGRPVRPG